MRPRESKPQTAPFTKLGVSGYTFADLHDPARLASLHDRFVEEVQAVDAALWREWDAYRRDPDPDPPAVALSDLLVRMAAHVSAFVRRLFHVEGAAEALAESTRAQDDLFRFKVDFVRRRVLPLVKGGARIEASADDTAIVEAMIAAQ